VLYVTCHMGSHRSWHVIFILNGVIGLGRLFDSLIGFPGWAHKLNNLAIYPVHEFQYCADIVSSDMLGAN
jgi:hypothetical protein